MRGCQRWEVAQLHSAAAHRLWLSWSAVSLPAPCASSFSSSSSAPTSQCPPEMHAVRQGTSRGLLPVW